MPSLTHNPGALAVAVAQVEAYVSELLAGLPTDALTAGNEWTTDTILLATTASSGNVQTWRAPRDGEIVGWMSSVSASWGLSINVDLPSVNVAAPAVVSGLAWPPSGTGATTAGTNPPGQVRIPFKANDTINVKTYTASSIFVWLFVRYPKLDIATT